MTNVWPWHAVAQEIPTEADYYFITVRSKRGLSVVGYAWWVDSMRVFLVWDDESEGCDVYPLLDADMDSVHDSYNDDCDFIHSPGSVIAWMPYPFDYPCEEEEKEEEQ